MEKEALKNLVDQGLSISKIAQKVGKGESTVRYHLKKHGLKTKTPDRSWTDDQLIEAVKTSSSMTQVIPKLGLSKTSAGNRSTIKKSIDRLNLCTSHWKGQNWSAGTLRPRVSLEEVLVEHSTYSTNNLRIKLLKEGIKEARCESCDLVEWMGNPIPLELDHINGISNDHRIENLRILCPNCHALTPTWRGRNKKVR